MQFDRLTTRVTVHWLGHQTELCLAGFEERYNNPRRKVGRRDGRKSRRRDRAEAGQAGLERPSADPADKGRGKYLGHARDAA